MSHKIKIKFESNQEHQRIAVDSVVNLFKDFSQEQNVNEMGSELTPNVSHEFIFEEDWLHGNLLQVQDSNNISKSISLDFDDGFMLEGVSYDSWRYPAFTVEMETGTGKTYAYFKTIHELKKNYGFRKFIIVVPSVAIYEGVVKTYEITKEHFKTLYGNETFNLIQYDSRQINKVKDFSFNPYITIMVMTIDAFNGIKNNIYKPTEKLPGEKKPFEYIQETRPILILDESQNYRSKKSKEALRTLKPLLALNYSATPGDRPNLIYRLTPVDALRMNLVKKIQVEGVTEQHNLNDPNLSLILEEVGRKANGIRATVKAFVFRDGHISQKSIELKKGDDLSKKTNNPDFNGFIVDDIHITKKELTFTNESVLSLGTQQSISLSKQEIFRIQIEQTIKYHFERQKALRKRGIKVLSLFFIDKVDNFIQDDGIIKVLFDNAFEMIKQNDTHFKKLNAEDVRGHYFAKKKEKSGEEVFIDTALDDEKKNQNDKEAEKAAYNLIMKDKETLLNFSENKSFIFAHSALREGWDNPNVFQICTLNTSTSESRKRQEIGRGLRLCVNQNGERVMEDGVNILTVVANESYEKYCENLQKEYRDNGDTGPTNPSNARRKDAERNDNIYRKQEFRNFWTKLCQKTDYTIKVDTPVLIDDCIKLLNSPNTSFPDTHIIISRGKFVITHFVLKLIKVQVGLAQIKIDITDTEGQSKSFTQWYKVGDDVARKLKEPRLSGFKVVEINEDSIDSEVIFGNDKTLTIGDDLFFDSEKGQQVGSVTKQEAQTNYPVFNLIDRTSKELGITRPSVLKIFRGLQEERKLHIFKNPEGFASIFISKIRETLANHIASKIEYSLLNDIDTYDMEELFPKKKKFAQRELIPGSTNSLYDQIQTDSDVERNFVINRLIEDDENGNLVVYFKFPASFKIKIPKIIGNYNPDWGIIRFAPGKKTSIQLVRETKGSMNPNLLQYPNEKRKIDCAKKHFKTITIDYRQVTDQIPNWFLPDDGFDRTDQISIAAEPVEEYKTTKKNKKS